MRERGARQPQAKVKAIRSLGESVVGTFAKHLTFVYVNIFWGVRTKLCIAALNAAHRVSVFTTGIEPDHSDAVPKSDRSCTHRNHKVDHLHFWTLFSFYFRNNILYFYIIISESEV